MRPLQYESGFSTLTALVVISCMACVAIALNDSMTVMSKARRDSYSNAEINAFTARIKKILSTQWSCTASLSGSNFSAPILLKDPANTASVLAQDGMATGPFWTLSTVRMQNVQLVPGRLGVLSGDLDLEFTKSMAQQIGAPVLSRTILSILFETNSEGVITVCDPSLSSQASASAACKSMGGVWNADQAYGSQCAFPGAAGIAPAPTASDPAPAPTATAAPAPTGVCFDTNAGIIAVPNAHAAVNGNGAVQSAVYLMNGAQLSLTGNAEIKGNLFEGTGSSVSRTKNVTVDHTVTGDYTSLIQSITDFATAQTALPSTTRLTSIAETTTLTGTGGKNVILVTGDVNLSGNSLLTLSGGANDTFVVNVLGKITISGNASIALTGGVLPKSVLFNNIGTGNEIVLSGNGAVAGTFLAMNRGAQISGNGVLEGALIAGGGSNTKLTISGNGLAITPQPFCN